MVDTQILGHTDAQGDTKHKQPNEGVDMDETSSGLDVLAVYPGNCIRNELGADTFNMHKEEVLVFRGSSEGRSRDLWLAR